MIKDKSSCLKVTPFEFFFFFLFKTSYRDSGKPARVAVVLGYDKSLDMNPT